MKSKNVKKSNKKAANKVVKGVKEVTVKQIISLLKQGKKVTTPNGVAHRLAYCESIEDKNKLRKVVIAA